MAAEKWYFIDVGKRRGPYTSGQLKELYLKGEVLDQTLLWKRGFETWPTFIKVFPDAGTPANKKEEAAKEKRRARIDLAPKSVVCGVCQRPWPLQYTLATRSGWVCLACKDKLDHEAIKTFDPRRLPKGGAPWPLIIVAVALAGFFFAKREIDREQERKKREEAEAQARARRTQIVENSLLIWGGLGRNSKTEEPWMREPPQRWPQLVASHDGQVGKDYALKGGNCVLIESAGGLVAITSLTQLHPHVAHYLRTLPAVPPTLFSSWGISGDPGKRVMIAGRYCRAEELADRDLIPFVVANATGKLPVPAVPLQVRVNPLLENEKVWVVVFEAGSAAAPPATPAMAAAAPEAATIPVPGLPARQKAVPATINYILQRGLRFEGTIDQAHLMRSLLGAPVIDQRGLLVGIIAGRAGMKLDAPATWIAGETSASIIELLEGGKPAGPAVGKKP